MKVTATVTRTKPQQHQTSGSAKFGWAPLRTAGNVKGTSAFPDTFETVDKLFPFFFLFVFSKIDRWAFVDFTSIDHATAALTNPKNHFLDGRNLVVEYASPDAVRRGGGPRSGTSHKPSRDSNSLEQKKNVPPQQLGTTYDVKRKAVNDDDGGDEERPERPSKKPRVNTGRYGNKRGETGTRTRAKPGAALAQAKREAVAIVPSQGQKIVF